MSNRPKGFKRIPIFYYVDNSSKIKSNDVRLPTDECYHRLVIQAKCIAKQCSRFNQKRVGSKPLRNIISIIKNW